MEIRVLRYFLAVVREEGINKAADYLHITQPTLSRQMAQLEDEIGVKLFHKEGRKLTLTNEGMLLRRRAEEILNLVDKTEKELIEQEEMLEGRIVIGSGELKAMQGLPQIIDAFHQKYPRVTFDIYTANADTIKDEMEKGLVDIGILLEPIDITKFDFIRLKQKERWVVLMRPDDPLAQQESVSAKDLGNKPLILPRRLNVQNEVASWLGDSYQNSQVVFTSNLSTNGALMVQGGLGYSLVIEGSVPFWDKNQITYRPLTPELAASCVIAWKKQHPLSLVKEKFIEQIKCFSGIS